jgi:hypothetical protein
MKSELYLDKNVCVMACGSSLDTHQIDFEKYDTVVGINRLYKTDYLNHMHILYDAAHYIFDPVNEKKVNAINSSNLKLWILTPGIITYNHMKKERLAKCTTPHVISQDRFYAPPVRITLGIYVLKDVIKERPKSMDIFGFDFYSGRYARDLPQMDPTKKIDDLYNLESQKGFLDEILNSNPNVKKF